MHSAVRVFRPLMSLDTRLLLAPWRAISLCFVSPAVTYNNVLFEGYDLTLIGQDRRPMTKGRHTVPRSERRGLSGRHAGPRGCWVHGRS